TQQGVGLPVGISLRPGNSRGGRDGIERAADVGRSVSAERSVRREGAEDFVGIEERDDARSGSFDSVALRDDSQPVGAKETGFHGRGDSVHPAGEQGGAAESNLGADPASDRSFEATTPTKSESGPIAR